ncbi:transporter substrate-binding domain-containing diguanylate cyclase [Geosporobacter ferrireducens]|uniref:GGDEF domain-containing protein n=1 Tax=Geosporobacter ferrireducens TaxID=1424294 RepID=A0A1D8GIP6_9FIRM|nr:transporter substrate-binding domain-containing protein [Geosporobacter ferrireducens]AOT70794.1 hypothetical protein Gferi_15245 [Geosporobacter ferrireducens]
MNRIKHLFIIVCIFFCTSFINGNAQKWDPTHSINLTEQEKEWLLENKGRTLIMGVVPYSGTDYYQYNGEDKGYLLELKKSLEEELGLQIRIEADQNWSQIYQGLQNGSIDILCGANETPDRKKMMSFTRPVHQYPYAVVAKVNGSIHTLGDIDNRIVGFIDGDAAIDLLPEKYKNIKYNQRRFSDQEEGIQALLEDQIDAFIITGGAVINEFIYNYPDLRQVASIRTITSDMTLSTRKEDEILARMLDKKIAQMSNTVLPKLIQQAEVGYYKKIMNLTESEREWLSKDGVAIYGVTKDYLPFDYYKNGQYMGISGQIIKEISRITGIQFIGKYEDFDILYELLEKDEIDLLNIARTEERIKRFHFPRPYSTERDVIIGRKESEDALDVYGLEGKTVAVIKGFWHGEHLIKNLTNVKIIETNNIQESLKLVHSKKADYLIENPTVARYYIEDLRLYDLTEKGVTSTDSYLYYGIAQRQPELAGIIDKAIPLLDIDALFKEGYREVPHRYDQESYKKLVALIIGLVILLIAIILYVIKLINDLIKEKTETELLRQREQFLYTDALTELHNRNYFKRKIKEQMDQQGYPQTAIICDINNLKVVNDQYGHHVGDELLKTFADSIRAVCPADSVIIRMGGDEFLILLTAMEERDVEQIIEEIKRINANNPISIVENNPIAVESAFGFATRESNEVNIEELIQLADKNMYSDKRKEKEIT